MTKSVYILSGGTSTEREVSIATAKTCFKALQSAGYNAKIIDITTQDPEVIRQQLLPKPDVVFNALHGTFGEDGGIQSILNNLDIPYTHSGETSSKIAMDKPKTIKIYKKNGIPVAQNVTLNLKDFTPESIPFEKPYVIKPATEGSSVGLYIIHPQDDLPDLSHWDFGDIMIEKYVAGLELTVTVLNNKALTVTELQPKGGIYDYDSKYQDGMTQHICPAVLPEEIFSTLLKYAETAHKALECRGISRTDFRYDAQHNILATLETNTQPGMTELSLAPEQAKAVGISIAQLVTHLIESAQTD